MKHLTNLVYDLEINKAVQFMFVLDDINAEYLALTNKKGRIYLIINVDNSVIRHQQQKTSKKPLK